MGDATRGEVSPAAATRPAVPSLPGGPVTRRRLVRDDQLPRNGDGMKLARCSVCRQGPALEPAPPPWDNVPGLGILLRMRPVRRACWTDEHSSVLWLAASSPRRSPPGRSSRAEFLSWVF